jgi:hypothetical protein
MTVKRIGHGIYQVTIPPEQSWSYFKHIRILIAEKMHKHGDEFLIAIWQDVEKHFMPDYFEEEIGSMGKLADTPVKHGKKLNFDCKIFINVPLWRRGIYIAAAFAFPSFGRETYFVDTVEEAIELAELIGTFYQEALGNETEEEETQPYRKARRK